MEKQGSLNAAAKELHLTPSALSQQLKDLESRLGGALFRRQWRRLGVTAAGRRLTTAAHTLLVELKRVEAEARSLLDGSTGTIRVATECQHSYGWIASVLKQFGQRWPGIELTVVPEAIAAPTQWLSERKLDVALVASGSERVPHVRLAPLFRDELVALVGKGHSWFGRTRVELAAFSTEHVWADADAFARTARSAARSRRRESSRES